MAETPKYTLRKVDELIPYINNARTHSPEQVTQIAASIKEFGFLNPIITDGENGVIAGHGRLLAAQKLGLTEVPCLDAGHLTKAQRKAYVIADNQLGLNSGWDTELLKVELEALGELDFDLAVLGLDPNLMAFIYDEKPKEERFAGLNEINVESFGLKHKCPKCRFEFDD